MKRYWTDLSPDAQERADAEARRKPQPFAGADPPRVFIDDRHAEHAALLEEILKAHKRRGGRVEDAIGDFRKKHKGISRTALTDYRGGRIKGHIGPERRAAIEDAIHKTAVEMKLINSE